MKAIVIILICILFCSCNEVKVRARVISIYSMDHFIYGQPIPYVFYPSVDSHHRVGDTVAQEGLVFVILEKPAR